MHIFLIKTYTQIGLILIIFINNDIKLYILSIWFNLINLNYNYSINITR